MKKIITVILILAAFAGAGFVCWKFFDKNYREYVEFARTEITDDEEIYFLDDLFVKADGTMTIYRLTKNGLSELYSTNHSDVEILYTFADYIITRQSEGLYIYYAVDSDVTKLELADENEILSAKQFGEMLVIKTLTESKNVNLYTFTPQQGLSNITESRAFSFCDYCVDYENGNEYYISYEASGEFIKLVLRMYNGGLEMKKVELDNVVYNSYDYINNMFVFYTDDALLVVNANTLVKRTFYCYDIEGMEKFIFGGKIVYYLRDAFFNGVNNMLVISPETTSYLTLNNCDVICPFGDKMVYLDGKYVRLYSWSDSLLDENVLLSDDDIKSIGVMKDRLVAVKRNQVIFLKNTD